MAAAAQLSVRALEPADLPHVGRVFRAAFNELFARNGHAAPVGDDQVGAEIARAYLELDPEHCLVVSRRRQVIGAGFLHPRGRTAGIGPVCVDPGAQGIGAGSALMVELCARADALGVESVRLVQDAFNETSFALYARSGFVPREVLVRATISAGALAHHARGARRARLEDLPAIVRLEEELLEIFRPKDVELFLRCAEMFVVEHAGEVRGSVARMVRRGMAVLGPILADSLPRFLDLLDAATEDLAERTEVRLLVPARLEDLLAVLLSAGLGVHSLCTYMVRGGYRPFAGYYVPTLMPESG